MIKKIFMPILTLAAIFVLASCAGKLKPLSEQYIKSDPQPLEAIGGEVPVTISIAYPAKWFNKNAVVTITPVLRYATGETWGTAYTYQGEKVRANNPTVIFNSGGNVTMRSSFKYIPEMKKSELYLTFDAKIKNKTIKLPDIKIADGVIATSMMADAGTANPAIGADKFQRIIREVHDANIMFVIQQAELRARELNKSEITDWKDLVAAANAAANQNVALEVSAYASPDGGLKLNDALAAQREANTRRYLESELKKQQINLPVDAHYTAQDWAGFQQLVSQSNLQDKDLVLRVLSMYSDSEERERQIKNISAVFKSLADEILPQLRRSRLIANIEIIGKSDQEISQLAQSNANALTVEELLYAATLTNNDTDKEAIYTKASELFANDYRGWNNMGMQRFYAGDLVKAEELFSKANSVRSNNESNINLGLIALTKGDRTRAEQLIGSASDVPELGEALGVLYLLQGDYARSVSSFGASRTNNAALAQLLSRDYSRASQTLNSVTRPDATTDYLKAIVAARTNDTNAVIENLKAAIAKKPALAREAALDLEFAKYATNSAFTSLVR